MHQGRFRGLLLGTAVGDSLGLPAEGLSRRRIHRLYGGAWRHRFLLRYGMVSAAYAWFRHFGDFRASLCSVLDCGGDTDTVGAIAGALAGSVVGEAGIPPDWLEGVVDWPRGTELLRELADRLAAAAAGTPAQPVRYCWPATIPRNLLFLILVLMHGFRRLAPPY